jgi:phage recombination protein Bet
MTTRKFTPEEIALVHRTFMDGASKDDVALFIATCERTGLDPFARQIMPSSRNTNRNGQWVTIWTWLVTIDGLRKIAVDSGDYEGQEGPWWCGKDGVWQEVWAKDEPCFAAKVLVHRKGFRTGLSGIAKYDSYVQKKKDGTPNQVWATLGDHMTAKCAEALALRRAYPNEMAGLYTSDEMAQAGFDPTPTPDLKPLNHTHDAPPPPHPEAWSIEALSEFEGILDRAYTAFRAAGMKPAYDEFAAKWKAAQKANPPQETLTKFEEVVVKLEAAAKKKAQDVTGPVA